MLKSLTRALLAVAFAVAFVCQATGTLAGTTGGIQGTVSAASGNPIAGVHVSVVAPSYTYSTVTASNGFYAMSGLPPDTYTVTFAKEGLQTQQITGETVTQDQTISLNIHMQPETVKSLGVVPVRAVTSIVQPKSTADVYTISPSVMQNITGTPQNASESAVLNSLPGVTTDSGGYPLIRGGLENDEGYQLEGIDATEPVTGQFINSLVANGAARLVISTGGYDASNGNTNSGVINEVVKRGAYPGAGESTISINSPNFDHRLVFDYGNASPDNRFSYFGSFSGTRQFRVYGDQHTFQPRLWGAVGDVSINDDIVNLFYRFGNNNSNEIQYFGETGANQFQFNYENGINVNLGLCNGGPPFFINTPGVNACLPYDTANALTQAFTGGFSALTTLFPGQVNVQQPIGYADNENNVHYIEKVNFKHQFGAATFAEIRAFRTHSHDIFLFPWDGGALSGLYEHNISDNWGLGGDYDSQISSKHELSFGAETIFTRPRFDINIPTLLEIFTEAHEFPYVGGPALPLFADSASTVFDGVHRGNVWLRDRWSPSDKWTVTPSVRFDQEIIELPSNAQALSGGYVTTAAGIVAQIPAPPIGNNVTRPSQVSPRLAVSYQSGSSDVFRASYGRFIEYAPTADVENVYNYVPTSLRSCTIASSCFTPLPGFDPSCVNGHDGAALCNNISNLYDQVIMDLNQNDFAQYTPLLPQRATAADFSWEHAFPNSFELKVTPYYRKGTDYIVANTPLITTLPDGTPVFGAPHEENSGINYSTGVEFSIQRQMRYGWSGFLNATYDNTLANYNSDFFPSTNNAALALGHFFHVSYLAPITATGNLNYRMRSGWLFDLTVPYESGYRYGVGKKTFVLLPTGSGGALVPTEVLNTDLAASSLGLNSNTSAYYFTDPANPGTIAHPNIIGSRGTADGDDPGTIKGIPIALVNLAISKDLGVGSQTVELGFRVGNLLGNYSSIPGGNSRYRNNGYGAFSGSSGSNAVLPAFEPGQFPRGPLPFEFEPTGSARLFTFFVNTKY